jgi:hypothetical protein
MLTWKEFYVELERRQVQIAEAEHYRLIKLCLKEREICKRNSQDRVSPMYFVIAKETK